MRNTRAIVSASLVIAVVALLLPACGEKDDNGGPSSTPAAPVSRSGNDDSAVTGQPDAGWSSTELAVLKRVDDEHPGPKEARFEAERNRVVVTLYTEGDDLSDAELSEIKAQAEEVTGGVPVVVVTTDDDPPTEG